MSKKNENTILFLYEGETEWEFYKIFFEKLPQRKIRISSSNLKGIYGLNDKVRSKIASYLQNKTFKDCNNIHLFVAYDREGDRTCETELDTDSLEKEFLNIKGARISSINEIIATQDLESWFFHDLKGIYEFLKTPKAKRNMKAFPNADATNNRILSALFHKNKKHYQKGRRVEGFLNSLDIDIIYEKTPEIQEAIEKIKKLMNG